MSTQTSNPPTYGIEDAQKLREIGESLFNKRRPTNIPTDIFQLDYDVRTRLYNHLAEIADEIESAPGPVEIELVAPDASRYSLVDSRNILYLLRTALA